MLDYEGEVGWLKRSLRKKVQLMTSTTPIMATIKPACRFDGWFLVCYPICEKRGLSVCSRS
jgi:hypothetical protein